MGKSTQATALSIALGVPRLRLGRHIKDKRQIQKTPEESQDPALWYQRLLAYTSEYLAGAVAPCVQEHGAAVLDGFPRGPREAEELERLAREQNWALTILHFDLANEEDRVNFSLNRQRSRAVALGRIVNDTWYWQKIRLAQGCEQTGIQRARELGVRIVTIDPRETLEGVNQAVRNAVRLDFERLPWNWDILRLVRDAAPEAFLVGGSFYRPFWNGIHGPVQEPWNIGVAVDSDERAKEVQERLEKQAPYRWRVGNAVRFTREKTGIMVGSVQEALRISHNLIGVSGGVRLLGNGHVSVVFGPDAEAHIRRGILQPSENANLEEAARKARMLVHDYPGLSAGFIGYMPVPIIPDWATIHKAVKEMESGGKRSWGILTQAEQRIAEDLVRFAEHAGKKPAPAPVPIPASPPAGFPWDAPDSQFHEWLVHELRDHQLSRDPFLEKALSAQHDIPQKPTHQGWKTHQHAAMTLLQLKTDHLPAYARRALRVAAVLHDVGKNWNMKTPGAHASLGAKKWAEYAPAWLADQEKGLVTFLINYHDLLGRVARGVKEPDYQGGIDPAGVRGILRNNSIPPKESLELILALNSADVGSVASLRWALPELGFAAKMIEAGL
jgi:adenylate kinase family enzyme